MQMDFSPTSEPFGVIDDNSHHDYAGHVEADGK